MKRSVFFLLAGTLALVWTLPTRGVSDEPAAPPNLLIDVSAALLNAVVHQKVDRTEDFADVLLETPTTGVRHTVGDVHAELVPDPKSAAFDVVLSAGSEAHGVGCRAIARLYTTTTAGFEVRSRIRLAADGFHGCRGPASAKAIVCLDGTTDREGDKDSLPALMARAGFKQTKDELEALVSRRTSDEASATQEGELAAALTKAQAKFDKGWAWARRVHLNVGYLHFSTTDTHLQARLRLKSTTLPLPGRAPAAPIGADLGLRVHQSFFNEMARAAFGGKTYNVGEVKALADKLIAPLLRDSRKADAQKDGFKVLEKVLERLTGKPASLTFAKADPVTITFTPETIAIEVHVAKVRLDGKDFPGMRIQAAYAIEHGTEGVQLVRAAAVQLLPENPNAPKKGAVSALLRPVLVALASEILTERMIAVDLPQPARAAAVRADLSDGWLTVAWKLRPARS